MASEGMEIMGYPATTVVGAVAVAGAAAYMGVMWAGTPAPAPVRQLPISADEKAEHKSPYGKGPHWSVDRQYEAPIKYAEKGIASRAGAEAKTLIQMMEEASARCADKAALRVERPLGPEPGRGAQPEPSVPRAEWRTWTYSQYLSEVRVAARAFKALGLKRFDGVNIWGFNSPEWVMGEMAAIFAGGIAAGIYPTDTPNQVRYKSRHSGASVAIVEDDRKKTDFLKMAKDLPDLKAIVVWAPSAPFKTEKVGNVTVTTWDGLKDIAAGYSEEQLSAEIASIKPGHTCAYIYTSGTTGNPKAVMMSHDNLLFESQCVLQILDMLSNAGQEERILSFLPLSHVAGMMVDIVCPIIMAALKPGWCTVHFARPYDLKIGSIGDRLRAVQPTLFLGVPRVWEKICEKMKAMVAQNPPTGLKLKIAKWSKGKGIEHQHNCQLGGSGEKGWGYGIAQKLVLNLVKQKLGLDECKFGFTGAAPITVDTLEYFGALGIQINEVYGMSECSGATTWSTDDAHVWGSCGWEMPGTEVKIFDCEAGNINKKKECPRALTLTAPLDPAAKKEWEAAQGEICFRGRHIMTGYMANPDLGPEHVKEIQKKNAEAIDDEGWLHSGDKGCISREGMVKITGRYKELIIGAGGENIAPVPIEDAVKKLCPAVSNIMLVGDKRKFLVALVCLKAKGATGEFAGGDELDGEAATFIPGITKISEAVRSKEYTDKICKAIAEVNKDEVACPSNASKVQKFAILPHDFSVVGEEFTPTLKLKRSFVHEKYHEQINKIYDSKDTFVLL